MRPLFRTLSPLGRAFSVGLYLLYDQFTTARSAGAVNGTSAEPIGGTRTVTDTTNLLSISGGNLVYSTGGVGAGNPGLWYSSFPRTAGLAILGRLTPGANAGTVFGFDNNNSGNNNGLAIQFTASTIRAFESGASSSSFHDAFSIGTQYELCCIVRNSGAYYFIKGGVFTNWTLLYASSINSSNPLYPSLMTRTVPNSFTADNIRIPIAPVLPTPVAYDTFTRSNGSIGNTEATGPEGQASPVLSWVSSAGSIISNKAAITPTLGSNLVTNGGFSADTNWTKGTNWTIGAGVATNAGSLSYIYQVIAAMTAGKWYEISVDVTSITGGFFYTSAFNLGGQSSQNYNSVGTWKSTHKAISTIAGIAYSPGTNGSIDNVTVKELALSSLFSSVSTSTPDVLSTVNIDIAEGTHAGIVLNLDSTSSPANFVIAYFERNNIKLEKCVGGVYTTLISSATVYATSVKLTVVKYGTKYRLYNNDVLVGTEQTVSDAGIISNTKHGLFSTSSFNRFDNFIIMPRGTSNEYSALDLI